MKNLFLSAALALAFAANAVTVNQIRTSANTTVNYQEKEYKVIDAEKYVYNSDEPIDIMIEQVSRAVKTKIKAMAPSTN